MKKFIILLFVFFMPIMAFANDDCKTYRLDNGQIIVIKQVKTNPIVTIDTWIKTGSIDETDKNNGVAHFLEHLFFKGSAKYAPGEFDRIIESKGGVTNAATSKDFTHYYITIPSDKFDLALDLQADMLLSPQIPRKELEKERKVVLEEIAKDLNSPQNKLSKNLTAMMFKTHPYKRDVIGTKKVIENISQEEIFEFYNNHYAPSNMVTVVVGDIEPEITLEKIKKAYGINNKKVINKTYKKELFLTSNVEKIAYDDISTGYMVIGYNSVPIKDKDTYALDILSVILGEGRSSKFYQNIKDHKQLAYSIASGNVSSKDAGTFIINANFQPENVSKLRKAIDEEIKKVQEFGISDDELIFAKSVIEKDTFFARESISDISSEIGYTIVVSDDLDYYKNYLNNINKVTKDEIQKVANKYLKYSATSILLPKQYEKQISSVKMFKKTDAKLVKETFNVKKYQLENKATLLINPNDSNDIVAISINAKGGEFLEPIAGTGFLMGQSMTKGTKKYSSTELSKLMEENGINIVPSSGGDNFSINILTTKTQVPKTLEILDEIVNNAIFDENDIEKDKNSALNTIKKSKDIPLKVALDGYKTLIFEGTPYSNTNSVLEKTLPKIQKSDILNFYNKIFYPENIVIAVNGNIDEKELINQFTNIFNGKKGSKFNYNDHINDIKPITAPKKVVKKIDNLQAAWFISGYQTSGNTNKKEYATLQIINTILGSGMSSRLFKNVRDEEGLAYQIGSSYSPNVLKGAFIVYIGTNPKTLNYSEKRLMEEVGRLKKEFVSDKELANAKDKLTGNYLIGLETNLDKAAAISAFEASGRGFEFIDEYKKLINSVTPSDIINVANKYFTENSITSIVDEK